MFLQVRRPDERNRPVWRSSGKLDPDRTRNAGIRSLKSPPRFCLLEDQGGTG